MSDQGGEGVDTGPLIALGVRFRHVGRGGGFIFYQDDR